MMRKTDYQRFEQLAEKGVIVPVFQELPADMETPVSVLERFVDDENVCLMESVENSEKFGRYSFLGVHPHGMFVVEDGEPFMLVAGQRLRLKYTKYPLDALRALVSGKKVVRDPLLPPLPGGAIGYCCYEAVGMFEKLPEPKASLDMPVCAFMLTDEIIAFDNMRHTMMVIVNIHLDNFGNHRAAFAAGEKRVAALVDRIQTPVAKHIKLEKEEEVQLKPEMTREYFEQMVEKAKQYITAGEIIQVVPSQSFSAETTIPPFLMYRALRLINPSPYMFYLKLGEETLVGSSPETLVKLENGRSTVRPIAGTRKRGATPAEDRRLMDELLHDEKECAEHLMLVDLARNDIGRTAAIGSVQVKSFMAVEKYSHVMHIVSDVEGMLDPKYDAFDLLSTTFPAGTLSGAPKIRAMEIIHELEPKPRGAYGGSVGYISYDGNMDMAITIRTLEARNGKIRVQAGAGIVYDSIPANEYQETINKAAALFKSVEFAGRNLK
ncbi:MAG: anthranilate synthase component I [Victivallales bacterium]|nr:anthranilate synthase component I [Victivallales bacterium]